MVHILIATPLYPPQIGGPATHVVFAEKSLAGAGATVKVAKFQSVAHLPPGIRHLLFFYIIWQRAKDADVVYALDPVSVGLPAALAALLRRKKFVLRVPGDFAWEQGVARFGVTDTLDDFGIKNTYYGVYVSFIKAIQTWVAKRATHIIVPSDYMKHIVSCWHIAPDTISVVYSAFETQHDAPPAYEKRPQHVVFAGRLIASKGILALVEAFSKVLIAYPSAHFFIIGEGVERRTIEQAIMQGGLTKNITLTGALPKNELQTYLARARIVALNSNYEGLSHVLLEAIDAGAAIVASAVGGNIELIEDNVTGLLVPYNDTVKIVDAMIKIFKEPQRFAKVAHAARERIGKKFTSQQSSDALCKILIS